ncbi:MAG: hypothetical protein Q8S73_05340 [Deltaproteobacteria bacterium]|nr:hypothetical protein [Deltaproteobacteria bacterium]
MDKPSQPAPSTSSAELVARLTARLPEAWRRDTSVTLWPDSLVLHFRDAQGHRHAFDIRPSRPGAKAFVAGEALTYGYLRVDDAVDDAALLDEYRAALKSVAGSERDILPWIQSGPAATAPPPVVSADPTPASPQLAARLTEALPSRWRGEASVELNPAGFVLRVRDVMGRHHAFDARRALPDDPAFVAGAALVYGYLRVDEAVHDEYFLDEYRAALTALASHERDFLPLLVAETAPLALAAAQGPAASPPPAPVSRQDEYPAPAALTSLLSSLLPEGWRHEVSATLSPPGGMVLHFRDAAGRQHAFDVRRQLPGTASFVTGEALAYGYLRVDEAVDEVAALKDYRAALTALAARERDLLPWIEDAPPAPPAEGAPEVFLASVSHLATAPLTALLTSLLPEGWRREVTVAAWPSGFALHFHDADGHRHAFDARRLQPGEPAFVAGETLAYGYLRVDPAVDEAAVLEDYRAALTALAQHERELLPHLASASSGVPEEEAAPPLVARSDEYPAPPALTALLASLLPEAWRHEVSAALSPPGGLVLHFQDAAGHRHALDARPRRPGAAAFVAGEALAYSYLHVDDAIDAVALMEEYRAALTALAAREREFSPFLQDLPPDPEVESEDAHLASLEPPRHPATALLTSLLPEGWRNEVSVVAWPSGFALHFQDAEGRRHAFDVRRLQPGEPAFVEGEALAYGYLRVDSSVDEATVLEDYRAALTALAQHEREILPHVASGPAGGPAASASPSPIARADEYPAPPALTALLTPLLPEDWRHEVSAALAPPGGMVLHFRDATGRRHALDARPHRPDVAAFVAGEALAYSYLRLDDAATPVALLGAYRTVLTALAAHEHELLPLLGADAAGGPELIPALPTVPRGDKYPTTPELTALLTGLLPEAWRHAVSVNIWFDGFVLHFQDAAGHRHAFDVRRFRPGEPTFVAGTALAYSYLRIDEAAAAPAVLEGYRATLLAFAARERDLLALLPPPPESGAPREGG